MDRQRYRLITFTLFNLDYALERIDEKTRRLRDEELFLSMPCTDYWHILPFYFVFIVCDMLFVSMLIHNYLEYAVQW